MAKEFLENLAGLAFSFMLILTLIVLTYAYISNYDTAASLISDYVEEEQLTPTGFNESQMPQVKQYLIDQCPENLEGTAELDIQDNKKVNLDCVDVVKIEDSTDLFRLIALEEFKELYNKDYACSFFGCFFAAEATEDRVNFLLSYEAHIFYENIYWVVIGITVVFGLVFAYFSRGFFKFNRNFGWAYTVSGVGFIFVELMKNPNLPFTLHGTGSTIHLMRSLLSVIERYLLVYFVIGIILLLIGYVGNYIRTRKNK